jgi:hypothetical protein
MLSRCHRRIYDMKLLYVLVVDVSQTINHLESQIINHFLKSNGYKHLKPKN